MTKPTLDRLKMFYEKGYYTREQIEEMYNSGKITYEEFRYIVGEENGGDGE